MLDVVMHTVAGNLLTPWLTARASRMSPAVIFVGALAWGWLAGIWGPTTRPGPMTSHKHATRPGNA